MLNQRPVGDLGNKSCNVSNKRRDPASSSLITQAPVQCASNSMPSSHLVTDQFEKPFATAQVAPMTRRFGWGQRWRLSGSSITMTMVSDRQR
jgi:hypothetical protein